jgi:hypothetical protein
MIKRCQNRLFKKKCFRTKIKAEVYSLKIDQDFLPHRIFKVRILIFEDSEVTRDTEYSIEY